MVHTYVALKWLSRLNHPMFYSYLFLPRKIKDRLKRSLRIRILLYQWESIFLISLVEAVRPLRSTFPSTTIAGVVAIP